MNSGPCVAATDINLNLGKMSFITKKDLRIAIREYQLDEITEADDTLVEIAISHAIGEMKPYLHRYDTGRLFATTANQRPDILVRFAVDIAIFELCSIALPDQDLENRRALYKRAIGWLKEVRDNDIPTELPFRITGTELEPAPDKQITFGSNPKRNNYY